jgi:hypothetical protein
VNKDDELAQAEHHILEATHRVAGQRQLVMKLEQDGCDTTEARVLLDTLENSLARMVAYRDQILREIAAPRDEPF